MVRIKILLKHVRIIIKKKTPVSGPFSLFNKMEHPRVKKFVFTIRFEMKKAKKVKTMNY